MHLHYLAAPTRIMGEDGRVTALEYVKMALGEADASGRRRPEPIPGSESLLEVDTIIAAIGQRTDGSSFSVETGLKTDRGGNVLIDAATRATSISGVFSSGDCQTGAVSAVEGIAGGRKAADAIHSYLTGDALPAPEPFAITKGTLKELEGSDEFTSLPKVPREHMEKIPMAARLSGFQEIELGYSEEEVRREASRCLECGCKADYYCDLRNRLPTTDRRSRLSRAPPPLSAEQEPPFIERDANECLWYALAARGSARVSRAFAPLASHTGSRPTRGMAARC